MLLIKGSQQGEVLTLLEGSQQQWWVAMGSGQLLEGGGRGAGRKGSGCVSVSLWLGCLVETGALLLIKGSDKGVVGRQRGSTATGRITA